MKKGYYHRKPRKTFIQWWDEKQKAEKLQSERNRKQREHDERLQMLMSYKEEAEDLLSERIITQNGKDVYQMPEEDKNMMKVWEILSWYPDLVIELQRSIPNVEYDSRIVDGLEIQLSAAEASC